jgi:hypothetical protein
MSASLLHHQGIKLKTEKNVSFWLVCFIPDVLDADVYLQCHLPFISILLHHRIEPRKCYAVKKPDKMYQTEQNMPQLLV